MRACTYDVHRHTGIALDSLLVKRLDIEVTEYDGPFVGRSESRESIIYVTNMHMTCISVRRHTFVLEVRKQLCSTKWNIPHISGCLYQSGFLSAWTADRAASWFPWGNTQSSEKMAWDIAGRRRKVNCTLA